MNTGSLRLRLLLAAALSIAFALFLTGLAIVQLFEREIRNRVRDDLNNVLVQIMGAVTAGPDGQLTMPGELTDPRFREPYGGRYWQVDFAGPGEKPPRPPLRSQSLWDYQFDAANPKGPEGETLIVVSRHVTLDSKQRPIPLWILAAAHEEEVQRPLDQLRDQLLISLSVIFVLLTIAAWVQVRVGLSPLATLRQRLAQVSAGKEAGLTGRFPSEVEPLVTELNAVLAARATSLERARRRAGDLAHGLKTPLTVLQGIARDLRRHKLGPQAGDIDEQVEEMRRHVERALARARLSSGGGHASTELLPAVEKVVAALKRLPDGEELDWDLHIPVDAAAPIEAGDLTELLGNLLDNARKWASEQVRVSYGDGRLIIEDDGSGVDEADLPKIAERGKRFDESRQGSGLGLSIVADIADIYGFEVNYGRSELGGLKVAIRL